jgi:hypothetical protein
MVFAHAHGRLQLEKMHTSRAGGTLEPAGIAPALARDVEVLAHRTGTHTAAYVADAVALALGGKLGADAVVEAAGAAWRSDDVSLKIWWPSAVGAAVTELAQCWDVSASDAVRNLLFVHLYGSLGYWRAVRDGTWSPCRRQDDADVPVFSRRQLAPRTQAVRDHGKSDIGFRLWCPAPMKDRLSDAAAAAAVTVSEHCRRVVASSVCGHLGAGV